MSTFGGGVRVTGAVNVNAPLGSTTNYTVAANSYVLCQAIAKNGATVSIDGMQILPGGASSPGQVEAIPGFVAGPGTIISVVVGSTPGDFAQVTGVLFSN